MLRALDNVLYKIACALLVVAIILLFAIMPSAIPSVYAVIPWLTYPNVMLAVGITWLSMAIVFLLHDVLLLIAGENE